MITSAGLSRERCYGGPTSNDAGSMKGSILITKVLMNGLRSSSIRVTVPPSTLPLIKASPSSSVGHPPPPTLKEIWDATKGNATYVEAIKQAKSNDVSLPAHDFGEFRSNITTFCALLFTLFGEGCDLYWSMCQIRQILSHLFCMQNKQAYTLEVCHQITWAIIVDTWSFFDNI